MQTIIRTWCKEEAFGGSQRCVYNFFRDTSSRGKWRPIKSDENFFIEREKKKKQYNITHLAFLLMRCKTKKKTKKKKKQEKRKKNKEKISYININRSKQKARRDSLLYRLFPFDSMDLWARNAHLPAFTSRETWNWHSRSNLLVQERPKNSTISTPEIVLDLTHFFLFF